MEAGKKAVHVKWAGKTIALGTFPPAEAEEKCAKAKALTRAWRSTIRPKPSREWVMQELEKNGVRVVTGGRAGRTAGGIGNEDDGEQGTASSSKSASKKVGKARTNSTDSDIDGMMQRRSSSIGYSMLDGDLIRRNSSLGLGQSFGLDEVVMPPHRPLVGGASAAAYEAARADHYSSLAAKKRLSDETPRRRSSFGMGVGAAGTMMSPSNLSASSANQHYEMLKLHHMNLLNEIQETTLMMNLYQQQQLQQQRQQLQEQESAFDTRGSKANHMSMTSQQPSTGGFDFGFMPGARGYSGMEPVGRSPSLGMGSSVGPSGSEQLQALLRHQAMMDGRQGAERSPSLGFERNTSNSHHGRPGTDRSPSLGFDSNTSNSRPVLEKTDAQRDIQAQEEEERILEERLQRVRAEIAERQREAEELEAASAAQKRENPGKRKSDMDQNGYEDDSYATKKRKSDDSGVSSSCAI